MKARFRPIVLSLACGLVLNPHSRGGESPAGTYTFVDADVPAMAEIRQVGEHAIDQIAYAMIQEVSRVLRNNPPAAAIGLLHLKNFKLPASSERLVAVEYRRTSLRVRNPANSPDPGDQKVLDRIMSQLKNGDSVSPVLILHVDHPGLPPEWRVYRPLATLKQCLVCHGPADSLDSAVSAALNKLYPDDAAVNYHHGEWRGVIRVSIASTLTQK